MEKQNDRIQSVDDELLRGVAGGVSMYDQAEGVNRNSWFVTIMGRIFYRDQVPPELQYQLHQQEYEEAMAQAQNGQPGQSAQGTSGAAGRG